MVLLPCKHIRVTFYNLGETIQKIKSWLNNQDQREMMIEVYSDVVPTLLDNFSTTDQIKVRTMVTVI
jgi:uncharacterized Zn finger protein